MIIFQPMSNLSAESSDGWTYVKLSTPFSSTSPGSGENVPGLSFTPLPNKTYVVKGIFILKSSLASDGARAGISWPTNLLHNVATIETVNNTSTTLSKRFIGGTGTQVTPNTAFPDDTNDWPAVLEALFITDATVIGDFKIVLANEVSGSTSIIFAGSYIAYKEI